MCWLKGLERISFGADAIKHHGPMELRELLLMGTTAKRATGRDIELHMKDQTLPRGGAYGPVWPLPTVLKGGSGNSSRPSSTFGGGLGSQLKLKENNQQMFLLLQPTSPEALSSHPISFLESLTLPSPSNSCLEVLTSFRT